LITEKNENDLDVLRLEKVLKQIFLPKKENLQRIFMNFSSTFSKNSSTNGLEQAAKHQV
jgi:hypothetical protein